MACILLALRGHHLGHVLGKCQHSLGLLAIELDDMGEELRIAKSEIYCRGPDAAADCLAPHAGEKRVEVAFCSFGQSRDRAGRGEKRYCKHDSTAHPERHRDASSMLYPAVSCHDRADPRNDRARLRQIPASAACLRARTVCEPAPNRASAGARPHDPCLFRVRPKPILAARSFGRSTIWQRSWGSASPTFRRFRDRMKIWDES